MLETAVIVPNWNGKDSLKKCLNSLSKQSLATSLIVVDNGSTDGSVEFIKTNYPGVELISHPKNLGFAAGVNSGIKKAIENGSNFIALFNNDAVAEKDWLNQLVETGLKNPSLGIITGKLLNESGDRLDSTGDQYTNWGLPFPRGRDETDLDKYDDLREIFAATGGASLYRVKMLSEIGLFDDDFFAYYEDVDLSFRAQLAGWKVAYAPKAIAYHQIGGTSTKIRGFTTYQTMKNLPWLFWKNMPARYLYRVGWRFKFAYLSFFISAISRGEGWAALKGLSVSIWLAPKKLIERFEIQKAGTVAPEYIWDIIIHDLPPNATKLRSLRSKWWKIIGKNK